jgi:hypothetical protein
MSRTRSYSQRPQAAVADLNRSAKEMIDQKTDPVLWGLLVSGLDDAREHLETLVAQMAAKGSVDEEEYRVALGHIYAHLNRAWNSRDCREEITQKEWAQITRFPGDVEPVG